MHERPILVPLAGLLLFFSGFSLFNLCLVGIPHPLRADAVATMAHVGTGMGVVFATIAAMPLMCVVTPCRVGAAIVLAIISCFFYSWATVSTLIIFYKTTDTRLYDIGVFYVAWMSTLLVSVIELVFVAFGLRWLFRFDRARSRV